MHVLPVLARMGEVFANDPVLVIGVHSAKFLSERDPENIRQAVFRHHVRHPVVVDSDHEIWQQFAVKAWPTIVLVDAEGYIRETRAGEVDAVNLASAIDALLKEGSRKGVLTAIPLDLAPDPEADRTYLRFPGKIHASGDRLFIADSGHNRLLLADLQGKVQAVIGEGGVGAHDGPASQASFHNPQGMSVIGDTLYVADTGNHLIRAVDLRALQVTTVAGTGEKGSGPGQLDPRNPRSVPLRSPWALLAVGAQMLIAMAGSHQIWVLDPAEGLIGPWAGSGREDHIDGPINEAAFAQPSGLAHVGRLVIVADSEVSSIRAIDLQDGVVRTIVGKGLFDFGDRDGTPDEVLLQHPLDVVVDTNVLYVADSYNNKIKTIAFGSMETRTVLGDGNPETMHEPAGLAVAQGQVFIADTNNHRILRGNPHTGHLEEFILIDD